MLRLFLVMTAIVTFMCTSIEMSASNTTNEPPRINMISPQHLQYFEGPTFILIAADAFDIDGTVAKVDFYVNGVKIGTDTTYPYRSGTFLGSGKYEVVAVASDNDGDTSFARSRIKVKQQPYSFSN